MQISNTRSIGEHSATSQTGEYVGDRPPVFAAGLGLKPDDEFQSVYETTLLSGATTPSNTTLRKPEFISKDIFL